MDENKKVEWGRGLRGIFELQEFFLFCLIFPREKCFWENPGTSLEEKKVETRILPRYSLGARVVPSPSTQIGELIFVALFIVTHKSCSTYNCWCTFNSCLNLSNAYVPSSFRRASHQSPLQRNVSAFSFSLPSLLVTQIGRCGGESVSSHFKKGCPTKAWDRMLQYRQVVWATVVCLCLIEAHSSDQKEGEAMNMRAHAISLYCVKARRTSTKHW